MKAVTGSIVIATIAVGIWGAISKPDPSNQKTDQSVNKKTEDSGYKELGRIKNQP